MSRCVAGTCWGQRWVLWRPFLSMVSTQCLSSWTTLSWSCCTHWGTTAPYRCVRFTWWTKVSWEPCAHMCIDNCFYVVVVIHNCYNIFFYEFHLTVFSRWKLYTLFLISVALVNSSMIRDKLVMVLLCLYHEVIWYLNFFKFSWCLCKNIGDTFVHLYLFPLRPRGHILQSGGHSRSIFNTPCNSTPSLSTPSLHHQHKIISSHVQTISEHALWSFNLCTPHLLLLHPYQTFHPYFLYSSSCPGTPHAHLRWLIYTACANITVLSCLSMSDAGDCWDADVVFCTHLCPHTHLMPQPFLQPHCIQSTYCFTSSPMLSKFLM